MDRGPRRRGREHLRDGRGQEAVRSRAVKKTPTIWARPSGFAVDSPLEEAVSSEPVSEVGGLGAWELRTIPRWLWMITEAEKGLFRARYAGFLVFSLGSFSRSLRS
jgi:hypothetical protein